MTVLTETLHAGGFMLSGNFDAGYISADQITVKSGQAAINAGTVLGKVSQAQAAAPIPAIVGTGTGAMTLLKFGRDVQVGSYVIKLLATSATAAFSVTAPDGDALPNGVVGTAYTSSHLSFLISSAGTMTLGDTYTVVVTAAGTPVVVGGTGTGTMSAITLGPDAQNGDYRVVLEAVVANGGDFDVIAPDGKSIGRFVMGTGSGAAATFNSSHVNFTLTDATDFIVGNYFNLLVAIPTVAAKYVQLAPTAADGSEVAAGILWDYTDASAADAPATAITRMAEVKAASLTWPAGITVEQKEAATAQFAALGIILR
jgi:hypothetical protein